ncbi:unnamed protein product [Caenorhabditis sp. 36 PRJEB53466]|nr:unnamed protein product [Caenorhabditis sp. 36 PRJEB53466]
MDNNSDRRLSSHIPYQGPIEYGNAGLHVSKDIINLQKLVVYCTGPDSFFDIASSTLQPDVQQASPPLFPTSHPNIQHNAAFSTLLTPASWLNPTLISQPPVPSTLVAWSAPLPDFSTDSPMSPTSPLPSPSPQRILKPSEIQPVKSWFMKMEDGSEEPDPDAYDAAGFGWVGADHPTRAAWSQYVNTSHDWSKIMDEHIEIANRRNPNNEKQKPMNPSGTTFSVNFMGYVPLPNSIMNKSQGEKDALVRFLVNTVVTSRMTMEYANLLARQEVEPFVSVDSLEVFLNVSNNTITFFHIYNGKHYLLGRYMNNNVSYYNHVIIDDQYYLGIVMVKRSQEHKRECNVIKLANKQALRELKEKFDCIHNLNHTPVQKLEPRLRSTQDYEYKIPMLACFHGKISHETACLRLSQPGDFLIRETDTTTIWSFAKQTELGHVTVTYSKGP